MTLTHFKFHPEKAARRIYCLFRPTPDQKLLTTFSEDLLERASNCDSFLCPFKREMCMHLLQLGVSTSIKCNQQKGGVTVGGQDPHFPIGLANTVGPISMYPDQPFLFPTPLSPCSSFPYSPVSPLKCTQSPLCKPKLISVHAQSSSPSQ